ncbi:hypothetical protein [Priestia koreensis]|uniref:hypothetical protein n=1 Tax=Priestia koreensis TaxID=284581 RepID=UPI0020405052|nr:hypothetical protein [Priestia koreensis]MCM3005680.1 hypothetical protein [Priestia koreensis]
MEREDLKKDITERIKSGEKRDFQIEKVNLSKNDPIIQSTKRLVGGVDPDYIYKQAQDFLNAKPDPDFGYKGRKSRTIYKVIESPGKFFGLKLGKFRLGLWIEEVRDEN